MKNISYKILLKGNLSESNELLLKNCANLKLRRNLPLKFVGSKYHADRNKEILQILLKYGF